MNPVDSQAPKLTSCPSDQLLSLNANCEAIVSDYTSLVVATDNCSIPSITQLPLPGTIITTSTLVTLIAEEDAGNTTSCSFNVNVADFDPPIITNCPGDQTYPFDDACSFHLRKKR